jgi:hypothetical protein
MLLNYHMRDHRILVPFDLRRNINSCHTLVHASQFVLPEKKRSWKKADVDGVHVGAQHLRRLHVGASPADIDQYTKYLIKFIQDLANYTIPWAKPPSRAVLWWTEEIRRLVRQERQERRTWISTGDLSALRRHQATSRRKKRP